MNLYAPRRSAASPTQLGPTLLTVVSNPRLLVGLLLLLALAACGGSSRPQTNPQVISVPSVEDPIERLLSQAANLPRDEAAEVLLLAAEQLQQTELTGRAETIATQIASSDLQSPLDRQRLIILLAAIDFTNGSPLRTLARLEQDLQAEEVDPLTLSRAWSLKGRALLAEGQYEAAINALLDADALADAAEIQLVHDALWRAMNRLPASALQDLASNASSYQILGWIELTRSMLRTSASVKNQLLALEQWQRVWARHPAAERLPQALVRIRQHWEQRPRRIALLLPIGDVAGQAIQEGFFSAFYEDLGRSDEVPEIAVYDTGAIEDIAPLYREAVREGADLVIGPLSKSHVAQLQATQTLPVPTLALNYLDQDVQALGSPDNLFQFGLAPEDEIRQAAEMAARAGFTNAALIAPEGLDYERLSNIFAEVWSEYSGTIVSQTSFSSEDDYGDIIKRLMSIDASERRAERITSLLPRNSVEFLPRRREDIDFIFLLANPRQGRQLAPTLAFYYSGDIPVYSRPDINDGSGNAAANEDLNGIIFTDAPWLVSSDDPLKPLVEESLRQGPGNLQRFRALGIDSYRLYARLSQLRNKEIDSVYGSTGRLTLAQNGRLKRTLVEVVFSAGAVVKLAAE